MVLLSSLLQTEQTSIDQNDLGERMGMEAFLSASEGIQFCRSLGIQFITYICKIIFNNTGSLPSLLPLASSQYFTKDLSSFTYFAEPEQAHKPVVFYRTNEICWYSFIHLFIIRLFIHF